MLGIMILPFGLMFLLIPSSTHLSIVVILKVLIPCILGGIVGFGFTFYVYEKLKLIEIMPKT